jgi:tetratricopeptide (TPR) repeat protein
MAFRVGCSSAFLVFTLAAIPTSGRQPPKNLVIQQSAAPPGTASEIIELSSSSNNPITVEMRGGEQRSYRVTLSAGIYVEFIAEQKGIDVVLVLRDPAGAPLLSVDSPNGAEGPETLSWIAKAPGQYALEIRTNEKGAAPGKYELRISALRPAVPQDEIRVQATVALAAGQIDLDEDSESSHVRAVEKFKEALTLLRQLHDTYREYFAVGGLCHELEDLNQYQEALGYCRLAEQTADARKDKIDHAT